MASDSDHLKSNIGPGLGFRQVPQMPLYVAGYTKKGMGKGGLPNQVVPILTRTRMGNPAYKGGLESKVYSSMMDDYLDSVTPQKSTGLYHHIRPGNPDGSRLSIASDIQGGRQAIKTKRNGNGRNNDTVDVPHTFWSARPFRNIGDDSNRTAIMTKQVSKTPSIIKTLDTMRFYNTIEHNPFKIRGHADIQAKAIYDRELGGDIIRQQHKSYQDNYGPSETFRNKLYIKHGKMSYADLIDQGVN